MEILKKTLTKMRIAILTRKIQTTMKRLRKTETTMLKQMSRRSRLRHQMETRSKYPRMLLLDLKLTGNLEELH